MAATPRVAAIGIGTAVAISLAIPLVAGIIATNAVRIQNNRADLVVDLQNVHRILRDAGLAADHLPTPESAPEIWDSLKPRVVGLRGDYAVFENDFPLHRLPGNVIAFVQDRSRRTVSTIHVTEFDQPDAELSDLVGSSSSVGIGVVFADGAVYILRDRTPLSVVRPFATRNTAVRSDRDKVLRTYQLNR